MIRTRHFVFIAMAIFSLVALLPRYVLAADLTPREIMQKVNDRDDGNNRTSNMAMLLIDKAGKTRLRQTQSFDKDKAAANGGEDRQRVTFFVSPADVKDTGFLTYDYEEASADDDQWLYLPALRKTKRIASSDKSGSFMGSDLNYSDMVRRDLDAYDFKLLKEAEVRGEAVWVIEAVPKTQAEIEETGYKKGIAFVRQDNFVVVRSINWTATGNKLKYMDVPGLELIDGIWTTTKLTMTTKKNKVTEHSTELTFSNIKYNQDLDDAMFSTRRLEKGL